MFLYLYIFFFIIIILYLCIFYQIKQYHTPCWYSDQQNDCECDAALIQQFNKQVIQSFTFRHLNIFIKKWI